MSKKSFNKNQELVYRKYHIPGCPNYMRRPKNAIYTNPSNSFWHEYYKFKIAYDLIASRKTIITEAVRNTKDENGKYRRVDIVELDSGLEIEIETDYRRAKRFVGESGVLVIKLWEKEPEILGPQRSKSSSKKKGKRSKQELTKRTTTLPVMNSSEKFTVSTILPQIGISKIELINCWTNTVG